MKTMTVLWEHQERKLTGWSRTFQELRTTLLGTNLIFSRLMASAVWTLPRMETCERMVAICGEFGTMIRAFQLEPAITARSSISKIRL